MDKETLFKAEALHRNLENLLFVQRELNYGKDLNRFRDTFPEEYDRIQAEAKSKAKEFIASKITEVESEIEKL